MTAESPHPEFGPRARRTPCGWTSPPYQPEPVDRGACAAPVLVREGAAADVSGCLDLVERVLKLDRAAWERSLTASATDQQRMLHVAEYTGRIVGYGRTTCWTRPTDAPPNAAPSGWYLLGLVVAPDHRRHGIGRALTVARLDAIAARAPQAWYFVNARNKPSLDLHATFGFVEVTRSGFVREFWATGLGCGADRAAGR